MAEAAVSVVTTLVVALLADCAAVSVTAIEKVVVTVCPEADCCAVGVNTRPSSAAVTVVGEPMTV